MKFLELTNNFLIWLDIYKLHILFLFTIIDSVLICLLSKMKYRDKLDKYINFHIKYGVYRTNLLKIFIAGLFLVGAPHRRDTVAFALIFIFLGIIIKNFFTLIFKKFQGHP